MRVIPNSPADKAVLVGDYLFAINGQTVFDILDCQFLLACDQPELSLYRAGQQINVRLDKQHDENAGLEFADILFDQIKTCYNKCEFCFVSQLPPNRRSGLYIKDDDFRLSFLNGCYITLTNLKESDRQKIIDYRLSPLYISVHSTNPELRCFLLGNKKAGNILSELEYFCHKNIQLYTQAVICPGINDHQELERTILDCAALYPNLSAIGIVPVGLTQFQKSKQLRLHSKKEAADTILQLQKLQELFLQKLHTPFVQIADEFFIKAEYKNFPNASYYPDYCLLENGIGLCRLFIDEFQELYDQRIEIKKSIGLITGLAGAYFFRHFILPLMSESQQKQITIIPIINYFFGATINVCGLLSGQDIAEQCPFQQADLFLLPKNCLHDEQNIFLDDFTLENLQKIAKKDIIVVENTATAFLQTLFELY